MKLLLLGGTAEARALAELLAQRGEIDLTLSLAGATRSPDTGRVKTRIGGFGGAQGFEAYLDTEAPDAVLDATHPFASRITRRSAELCAERDIPYLLLLRSGWEPQPGDLWTDVADEAEAVVHIRPEDRVFLATGRQTLSKFAAMNAAYTWCRQIDPPDRPYPFDRGEYLVGRPPFSVEDEISLFKRLGITVLVVKHAGGDASRSKLDAARQLGIPVLMIRRPDYSGIPSAGSLKEAMNWVEEQLCAHHPL